MLNSDHDLCHLNIFLCETAQRTGMEEKKDEVIDGFGIGTLSIGIVYLQHAQQQIVYDKPTHVVELPEYATLALLKEVLLEHFESNTTKYSSEFPLTLYIQVKNFKQFFNHEAGGSNSKVNLSNHQLNRWIEIPDDYLRNYELLLDEKYVKLNFNDNLESTNLLVFKPKKYQYKLQDNHISSHVHSVSRSTVSDLEIGDICEALDQNSNWYEAIVIDKEYDSVCVHFIGWSSKWVCVLFSKIDIICTF